MKHLTTYIKKDSSIVSLCEKLRINREFIDADASDMLYDTFDETIRKNYRTVSSYEADVYTPEKVKHTIDDLLYNSSSKIYEEVMNKIDDLVGQFKLFNKNYNSMRYELDKWLVDYDKKPSIYAIVKEQCEYIYGEHEPEEGLVYYTNYFEDVQLLGTIVDGKDVIWIREK